ncbi:MAG: sulfatase-like hydrolase/transferase [Armatimonadota bacterium]|nr:sulfatase-like hydrolase/transferase [Armatimonadota bacterium]
MAASPNILVILTDQHSPHVAGFAGDDVVRTRALDTLAERSVCFDAAYCQSPLCVPSRMSMLAGLYPHRCSGWDNSSVLSAEHATLPGWLSQRGYVTAAVGKMHFRGPEQMHGLQHRPYGDLVESRFPAQQPDPPATADGRWNRHEVGRFPFAGPTHIPQSMLIDSVVTRESLAWLLDHAASEPARPWLFVASYSRPHFPLTAPRRYIDRYAAADVHLPELPEGYPEDLHRHDRFIVEDFRLAAFSDDERRRGLAAYCASVNYVDDCIGDLLAALTSAGLLDNTLVIYTSDHGEMGGQHGLWWKRTYYEASSRVPLLISGPGICAGRRESTPVELVDLFPTCCEWCGVDPPAGLDGESLMPLLTGRPDQRRKRSARSELLGGRPETRFRMVRDERWKAVDFPDAPPRLFDLHSDPGERQDLAQSPPTAAAFDDALRVVRQGGDWDALEARRRADRQRMGEHRRISNGAVQYRLPDGSLLEADAHLYPPP